MSKTRITWTHIFPPLSDIEEILLRDMLLEVADGGVSKILLAIADTERQHDLNVLLENNSHSENVRVKTIYARDIPIRELVTFFSSAEVGSDALSIIGISELNHQIRTALIHSLNFHRDAVLSLSVPIVIWLTSDDMYLITSKAVDLWSRRTAVYQFEPESAHQLIAKLFRNSPIPQETWKSKDALFECLETVLSKEGQLRECIKGTSELNPTRAKECQNTLLRNAEKLSQALSDGRQVELALWLWNVAGVAGMLRNWLAELDYSSRTTFEGMYADRNELLLVLAEKMPLILRRYKRDLHRALGRMKSASLIETFCDFADRELDKITSQLHALTQFASPEMFIDAEISGTAIQQELTAEDLEKWLSGQSSKRPRYLTAIEGDLLKSLYNQTPVMQQAHQFGAGHEQVLLQIEALELKLRYVLGITSRRKQKQ